MSRVRDSWWDWRGGVNTTYSPDALDKTEVRRAVNARLTTFGALSKHGGSQRIHATVLAASTKVLGGCQWDNPSQVNEIVAICGGNLKHKALADADFTNVAGTLSTTARMIMAPYRVGGVNRLYIADGGLLNKWTATTLTENIAGSPSATFVCVYKERMFCADGTHTIYWSKIADPETYTSPNGGQANVDTYDAEPIVGLATCGSSLLIFKEDSVARFTGTENTTIQIDKDTEGVAKGVGCIAPGTIVALEDSVFFLSDRGPYIANENGVLPIGQKIEAELASWDHLNWQYAWAVYNKDKREIELIVPDNAVNDVQWTYNERTQSWTGPHSRGYNIVTAWKFERTDGTQGIMFGGDDGWVRDGDNVVNGYKDDVLSNNTAGSNISMTIEFAPALMGDPGANKIMHAMQWLQADLGASGSMSAQGTGDERPSSTSTFAIPTKGAGVRSYPFSLAWRGHRPVLTLVEATSNAIDVVGLTLEGVIGRRLR